MTSGGGASQPVSERLAEAAEACQVLAMEGHNDLTRGQLSIRDPDGRGLWLKRGGISLAEVRGAEDFLLLGFDGKVLAGSGARHAEWPIHTEIYRLRPDIHAIGHTHPRYACLLAATAADLVGVTREGTFFHGRLARYDITSNLIATPQLGAGVAEALGSEFAVLMRNHGITFCGRGIGECVVIGVLLERACRAQLLVNASGLDWSPSRPEDQEPRGLGPLSERDVARFWNYYRRKLARARRLAARRSAADDQRHAC